MFNGESFNWRILAGLLVIFSIAAFFICGDILEKRQKIFQENEIREIKIGDNIFQAEIAADPIRREQGLSNRKDLCGNCAMLFVFDKKSRYAFWMKEMNFNLDIIWIGGNEVVHIAKNVSRKKELEFIKPEREADKVLEINDGLADKLDIKIGDRVKF